jgi:tetratricopeptide (TPR) repeat protein
MIRFFRLALLALWLSSPFAATADQDDPRLGGLFDRLQTARNLDEADVVSESIWAIWTYAGIEDIDRLMSVGIVAMAQGQFSIALAAFDAIVAKAPKFAEGWNKRATIYYLIGRYQESIADVERTLALEPRHYGAISGLGLIHLALGEDKTALEAFERALRVNPHMPVIVEHVRELKRKIRGRPT